MLARTAEARVSNYFCEGIRKVKLPCQLPGVHGT
jgi:hypothetical protein